MAGSIIITGTETAKEQSGGLRLVHPDTTARPRTFWNVPRWWYEGDQIVYQSCARVDNDETGESIYIATETEIPRLKIRFNNGCYFFDEDFKREYVHRVWVTSDPTLKTGVDFFVPLRGLITPVLGNHCTGTVVITCINISSLPILGVEQGVRPKLPCVFGQPVDITLLPILP